MRTLREVRLYHFPLLSGGWEIGDEPIVESEFGGLSFVRSTLNPSAGSTPVPRRPCPVEFWMQ